MVNAYFMVMRLGSLSMLGETGRQKYRCGRRWVSHVSLGVTRIVGCYMYCWVSHVSLGVTRIVGCHMYRCDHRWVSHVSL